MNINVLIINCLLVIYLAIYGYTPNVENKTKQANDDFIKSINEKEQKGEIVWVDETQGYFIDSRDNNKYRVVKIGSQTWFAENLAYEPAFGDFWAYDQIKSNALKYGYLYFWETANKVCPTGWHLANNEDWNTLFNYLGGKTVAGSKLKATNNWNNPNKGVTNSSGFNALPAGNRAIGGLFYHLGDDALFWSGTLKSSKSAWKVRLNHDWDSVGVEPCYHLTGLSVRCIRD
ncbi:MAG: FISUMP domain-containing protein [Bacteroidales bacterium]|nr:FISUMP domain-containing protein [Bacteroidales bacterium]